MERKIFFLILAIFLSAQTISQINFEEGYIIDTINKTQDNLVNNSDMALADKAYMPGDYGGMPRDMEIVDNNIFIYTDKKLLKLDEQFNIINSWGISNAAVKNREEVHETYRSMKNHLAYSSSTDKLYVANNDGEIGFINNGYYVNIINSSIEMQFKSTKIVLDEDANNLIWMYNTEHIYPRSIIKIIDLQSQTEVAQRNFGVHIRDISVNNNHDIIVRDQNNMKLFNTSLIQIASSNDLAKHGTAIYLSETNQIVSYNSGSNVESNITIHDGNTTEIQQQIIDEYISGGCDNYLYSPEDDAVFFTNRYYNPNSEKVLKLYPTNNGDYSIMESGTISEASAISKTNDGNILVSGTKKILKMDPETLESVNENEVHTHYTKAALGLNNEVIAIGSRSGIVSSYDSNLNETIYKNIGINAEEGCINPVNGNYYYISSDIYNRHSSLYIMDENNNLINSIELGSKLENIVYNNQYIYVSSNLSYSNYTNKLYVIDATNNQLIDAFDISANRTAKLYSSENYTYLMCDNEILQIKEGEIVNSYNALNDTYYGDFYYDNKNNISYFLCSTEYPIDSKIFKLNENTSEFEEIHEMTNGNGANYMYVRPEINRIYLAQSFFQPYIKVMKLDNFEVLNSSMFYSSTSFKSFEYSPIDQNVYILANKFTASGFSHNEINMIYPTDTIKTVSLNIDDRVHNYKYNPINNKLYLFGTNWNLDEHDPELRLYECKGKEGSITGFLDLEEFYAYSVSGINLMDIPHNMFVNVDSNKLYVGNHTFSNACVVQCPPFEKEYNPGWTWNSYPILERENDNPVPAIPLLENLEPMPSSMKFYHLKDVSKYDDGYWGPEDVTEIQSTLGYKLQNNTQTTSYLETPGTLLDEEHPIELSEGENWIGYFPQQPRDAFDALQGVLDDIDMFKTQDGGCYKDNAKSKDSGEQWICWINEDHGYTALERGEMVVVNATSPTTLVWNQDAPVKQKQDLPESQNFTYQELADYQSIFVETDTSQVDEIGVFLNGECIGAAVVVDTLQEVRAYIPEDESGTLSFELYSQGSRSKQVVKSYEIIRPRNKQQTAIRAQNKARYYWVSLKSALGSEERKASAHALLVYPNPTSAQVTFRVNLKEQTNTTLKLYNSQGALIDILQQGTLAKGSHTFTINARENLPAGVYLYTFKTNEGVTNGKIVIE